MSASQKDSRNSEHRGASIFASVEIVTSILSPVDMFVNLLFQPMRHRDGVQEDIDAARRRQQP